MRVDDFVQQLNTWGQQKVPFLFLIDFEWKKPMAWTIDQVDAEKMLFSLNGFTNASNQHQVDKNIHIKKNAISREEYKSKFNAVYNHLSRGDSFLVNLTVKTAIEVNRTLQELFYLSEAKYKCWLKNQFLFFSPETFIQIRNQKIHSYPMKGTIDASIENACEIILASKKELAEHITIVDLIRNDLSQVSSHVTTSRFRYVEEITTHDKTLLQVSSEIVGELPEHFHSKLGDILLALLPAGSVSGAPKKKTCQVIQEAEGEDRGYYTGVFGYFDGENLDSGVAIRFIEQEGNSMYFRSGGGITAQSRSEEEYVEAIQKIYVPVN
jgi:para-aminobenzoate synthetase component 1